MPRKVTKASEQDPDKPSKFKIGHLGNLNQVTKQLGKTIRAMADGTIDSQSGARIANALGILRACQEALALERLERRLAEIEDGGETAKPITWMSDDELESAIAKLRNMKDPHAIDTIELVPLTPTPS